MTALLTPSLIAPSHPLVATQLQIKDAHVLGDFTQSCLAVVISSLVPDGECTQTGRSTPGPDMRRRPEVCPLNVVSV